MTAGEGALLHNVTTVMSEIIAIISDKFKLDYTMCMREYSSFSAFGYSEMPEDDVKHSFVHTTHFWQSMASV
jgi:hypothetical protein